MTTNIAGVWKLALVWALSLVAVAVAASALTFAQARGSVENAPILSGSDIGFRVEGKKPSGAPIGTFMVRVDGRWVEANWATKMMQAK